MQIYQYCPRDMRLDTPAIIRIARENGAVSVAEPLNLGARVRELRKERGWTLEQAAGHAGLARSTLSKIENGQMSPTYEALKKLAEGLAISVPQLFIPPSSNQVLGRLTVTKVSEGRPMPPRLMSMSYWPRSSFNQTNAAISHHCACLRDRRV